jgi:hypothetical protein
LRLRKSVLLAVLAGAFSLGAAFLGGWIGGRTASPLAKDEHEYLLAKDARAQAATAITAARRQTSGLTASSPGDTETSGLGLIDAMREKTRGDKLFYARRWNDARRTYGSVIVALETRETQEATAWAGGYLAWGFSDPRSVIRSWLASPPHRG